MTDGVIVASRFGNVSFVTEMVPELARWGNINLITLNGIISSRPRDRSAN